MRGLRGNHFPFDAIEILKILKNYLFPKGGRPPFKTPSIFLVILLFSTILHATELETDYNITQNISIPFNHFTLHTQEFNNDPSKTIIKLNGPYTITFPNDNVVGKVVGTQLYLDKNNDLLKTKEATITVKNIIIKGEVITASPTKIVIKNALYTTCSLIHSHRNHADYFVYAKKLIIYPYFGSLVAIHTQIGSKYIPFNIPLPLFAFGLPQYSIIGTKPNFPKIGSNQIEGIYAKSYIPLIVHKHHYGTIDVGGLSKLGIWMGGQYGYTHSKSHHTESRLHLAGSDGLEGQIAHHWILKKQPSSKKMKLNRLLSRITHYNMKNQGHSDPLGTLSLTAKYRELIHFNRVSYFPLLQLQSKKTYLPGTLFKWSTQTNIGNIQEERQNRSEKFRSGQFHLGSQLNRTWTLPYHLHISAKTHYKGFWYGGEGAWHRFYETISLHKESILNPHIFYTKHITPVYGESPFEFERQFAIISDEIGATLSETFFDRILLETESHFNLDTDTFRIATITLGYNFHCWQFKTSWEVIHGTVTFGLELL
jgi:hypothetical protein